MADGMDTAIEQLERIRRHLEIAYAGVVVSAAALLRQRAEQDEEIADVLRHCVGQRLFEQIERIDTLVAALRAPKPTSDGTPET